MEGERGERMIVFSFKLPLSLMERFEEAARETGLPKAEIARRALQRYLDELQRGGGCR